MIKRFVTNLLWAVFLVTPVASGAEPKSVDLLGVKLRAVPDEVLTVIKDKFKNCVLEAAFYLDENKKTGNVIAQYEIGACEGDVSDNGTISFVHSDVSPEQPLYAFSVGRVYPDPSENNGIILYSYEKIRASLISKYGNPSVEYKIKSELFEPVVVKPDGSIATPYKNAAVYEVGLGWGGNGIKSSKDGWISCFLDCGDFLKVTLKIAKRKGLHPANQFYVRDIDFELVDEALSSRQRGWSVEFNEAQAKRHTSF